MGEIYVADCPWCKKLKNESGKPKKFLFPGELKEARSAVDKRVLEWSKGVSHSQASAEALYSKSNETLDKLEVAVAHSNEMFTSEHAHAHLEHFLKRLEKQAFNVSKAVKAVIKKRIASSKKALRLKNQFIKTHASSSTNETDADNSTSGMTGGATGGATGATGGATGSEAGKDAQHHNEVASFAIEKAGIQLEISNAKEKYRDVDVNDTNAHIKLRAVEELARRSKSLADLDVVRMQFKAVVAIFEEDEEEDATGGATGEEGDEDETGATGGGNTTALLKELDTQKALVAAMKEKHHESEAEWANAKDIMKRDLEKKDEELNVQKKKCASGNCGKATGGTGTADVTDEEVEEAIEGTSMLLHHVVPSKNRTAAKDFPTGATGNTSVTKPNVTTCKLSPMDKKEECKVFSVYGKKCNKDLPYSDAQAVCEEKGAHICSQAEMVEAFKTGYESAACGWTSTETTMGHLVEMV